MHSTTDDVRMFEQAIGVTGGDQARRFRITTCAPHDVPARIPSDRTRKLVYTFGVSTAKDLDAFNCWGYPVPAAGKQRAVAQKADDSSQTDGLWMLSGDLLSDLDDVLAPPSEVKRAAASHCRCEKSGCKSGHCHCKRVGRMCSVHCGCTDCRNTI